MNKKLLIVLILFLISNISKAQIINDGAPMSIYGINKSKLDSLEYRDSINEPELSYLEAFLDPYVTEVNSIRKDSLYVPPFFYDENFDLKDEVLSNWYMSVLDSSQYVSLRIELFRRINNLVFLNYLVNELKMDKSFKCIKRKPLPSDKYSNFDLGIMRRVEIEQGINVLVKTGLADPAYGSFVEKPEK